MGDFGSFGKLLVAVGGLFVLIGLLMLAFGKIPWIGHLPGDIYIKKGNFSFYFPVVTCIIVSVLLTLIFSLFSRR
ncbi:MAG TPA: DUF2905 domain-containing protein [Firmicutes bacterium]|nr:DUF2905 domain-containing protein [Bacillota bacterium]HHY98055.1 DUF2905 domain-containing protein [Bacillota bacterium]